MTAQWDGRIAICVIGFPTARRLLATHARDLKPLSIVLDSIVPNGFLRMMEGEVHKYYRPIFSRAFDSRVVDRAKADIAEIIAGGLQSHWSRHNDPDARLRTLEIMTLRMLMRTCLGIGLHHARFAEVEREFLKLGPRDFVWMVGEAQKEAFATIFHILEDLLKTSGSVADDSVLERLQQSRALNPTTIGNLIYMVEMGRHDLKRYFNWIVNFASNSECLERLSADQVDATGCPYSRAVALETLRLEQSERLMRLARNSFIFDGYFVPQGAVVWISLWEAHKNRDTFADPYTFSPDRFLPNKYGLDEYAPFGLDQHRCPAAEIVIRLATEFSKAFAEASNPHSVDQRALG